MLLEGRTKKWLGLSERSNGEPSIRIWGRWVQEAVGRELIWRSDWNMDEHLATATLRGGQVYTFPWICTLSILLPNPTELQITEGLSIHLPKASKFSEVYLVWLKCDGWPKPGSHRLLLRRLSMARRFADWRPVLQELRWERQLSPRSRWRVLKADDRLVTGMFVKGTS